MSKMAPGKPEGQNAPVKRTASTNPNGVVKRRHRIPLSCESCRSRKLKCDRQKPCQNCKAREQGSNCHYASDEGKANRSGQLINLSTDMGDRVQKLEALVHNMLTAQQATAAASMPSQPNVSMTTTPSNVASSTPTEPNGYPNVEAELQRNGPYALMTGSGDGQQFLGPSHWEAVLRDIAAIRESIEESSLKLRVPMMVDNDRPAILRGVPPIASKAELMQTLPTKSLADRLLARYWEFQDPSMPLILHQATFKNHFDAAYENLETISFWRLAMLFTVFSMALQSYERHGPEPPDLRGYIPDLANNYRQSAASCIWAADIANPAPESLTALHLYWLMESFRCPRATSSLWMLQSMVIRKAQSMGYHRDPKTFPDISIFEGEMRRRAWHALCQSDLLSSFQLGLPAMVDYGQTDVQAPRSLYEETLHEDMMELPEERPKNEKTPVAYAISKRRIFQVFASIIRAINNISQPSDDEVAKLNAELTAAYEDIHPHLREESLDEPERHRKQRLNLAIIYHKAMCVLNRRALFLNNRTSVQEQSRDICIKSAMAILSFQDSMHRSGDTWYEWNYIRNDFLLASVLVCMILYTFKKYAKPDSNMFDLPSEAEESIYRSTLLRAKEIWLELSDVVPEARRAWQIIEATLHQTSDHKSSMAAESVESAVYSALATASLTSAEFVPVYSAIDFEKIDWDSWDKMISSSNFDPAREASEPLLQANMFPTSGV